MKKLNKTMVVIGCHWRWDIATKAELVEHIIQNGIHMQEGTIKDRFEVFAKEYDVSMQSINNWVKQYQFVYRAAKKAPKGTIIFSPLTVKNGQEKTTQKALKKLHKQLAKLRKSVEEAPLATESAETVRNTMKAIQEELSEASIKSE